MHEKCFIYSIALTPSLNESLQTVLNAQDGSTSMNYEYYMYIGVRAIAWVFLGFSTRSSCMNSHYGVRIPPRYYVKCTMRISVEYDISHVHGE